MKTSRRGFVALISVVIMAAVLLALAASASARSVTERLLQIRHEDAMRSREGALSCASLTKLAQQEGIDVMGSATCGIPP